MPLLPCNPAASHPDCLPPCCPVPLLPCNPAASHPDCLPVLQGLTELGDALPIISKELPYHTTYQNQSTVLTAVRSPLARLQSHYQYHNTNHDKLSFEKWYLKHASNSDHTIDELGWERPPGCLWEKLPIHNFLAFWLGTYFLILLRVDLGALSHCCVSQRRILMLSHV